MHNKQDKSKLFENIRKDVIHDLVLKEEGYNVVSSMKKLADIFQ